MTPAGINAAIKKKTVAYEKGWYVISI